MKIWLLHHRQAITLALRRLWFAPVNTLLAMLVIGIALAIPAGGAMLLGNAARAIGGQGATPQITVFLKTSATSEQTQAIGEQLAKHTGVRATHLISREDALTRMREQWAEALSVLPGNPFPDAWVVETKNIAAASLNSLAEEIRRWPQVEHVETDTRWAKRLEALLTLAKSIVLLLAVLLGAGTIAIVFNTIRLQVLTARMEIEVSRLLGATNAWIGRPYYYFGALQGLLGAIAAAFLLWLGALWLAQPVRELALAYGANFLLMPPSMEHCLIFLALAVFLGWSGAALSLARHLRE